MLWMLLRIQVPLSKVSSLHLSYESENRTRLGQLPLRLSLAPSPVQRLVHSMVKAVLSFSVVTCVLTSSMDGPGVKSLIFFVTVSLHVEPELFWNSQIALELCFRVWLAVANSSFF